MGNGTVTSKFKLSGSKTTSGTGVQLNQSNIRGPLEELGNEKESLQTPCSSGDSANTKPVESSNTHHSFNCDRCYKLKKKCLRQHPECNNCKKAGAECAYIDRSNKRRKKTNSAAYEDKIDFLDGKEHKESTTFRTVNEKSEKTRGSSEDLVISHKLVSVSSLLSNETSDNTTVGKDIFNKQKKHMMHPRNTKKDLKEQTAAERLAIKSLKEGSLKTNLKEEFITMKAMNNELASYFMLNYFHNYAMKYPFIKQDVFMDNFKKINFEQEMIINLDVYLLMSIGCIMYDYNNDTSLFDQYFNDNTILSVIDILNFGRNNDEEEDFANLSLLMLLTIYAIKVFNVELCWKLVGVIDRLIIELDFHKPQAKDQEQQKRIFWSAFNLDHELNLLLHRPSQIPRPEYIKLDMPLLGTFTNKEPGEMILKQIELHKLQCRILDLQLREVNDGQEVKQLSRDLENWRVSTSLVIHNTQASDFHYQDYVSLVNLNYYYLLIELDQLSSSESFQFTLQFLSNSFTLLISDPASTSKPQVMISVNSLFWYTKLFNVIKYNVSSLHKLLEVICNTSLNDNSSPGDIALKLSDFNSNLQLMLNLLKYLSQAKFKLHPCISRVNACIDCLGGLNLKLLNFNLLTCTPNDKQSLLLDLESIENKLRTSV